MSLPNFDTYGATSLFTTAGDLLKWEANFLRPTVGDEAMLREMMASAVVAGGDSTGYGLGIVTEEHRGVRMVGHGGADAGYRSYLTRVPAHGLSVAVLCNASTANPGALARGVVDALLGDRLAAAPAPVAGRATLTAAERAAIAGVYVHPVTGAPSYVSLRGDTLVAGRVNGPALVPLGEGRFRVSGQPVELAFADGEMRQTVLQWPAPTMPVLRRREAWRPTRAELERYAGTYHSEELGATYTVAATDTTLVLRTRWGTDRAVRPAYADVFAGDFLLQFTRSRNGEIGGMTMGSGRVRGVRFERVAAGDSRPRV